jgi:hypothetical protein
MTFSQLTAATVLFAGLLAWQVPTKRGVRIAVALSASGCPPRSPGLSTLNHCGNPRRSGSTSPKKGLPEVVSH